MFKGHRYSYRSCCVIGKTHSEIVMLPMDPRGNPPRKFQGNQYIKAKRKKDQDVA